MTTIHKLIRSKRRTLSLQITKDAELIVRAPLRASLKEINEIVRDKSEWIKKKQAWIRENHREPAKRLFTHGETLSYLGQTYPITHTERIEGFTFNGSEFLLNPSMMGQAEEIITDWYKWQALNVFTERVKHYAARHGFEYAKIKLSNAGTRWGSCSHDGNLNFNWRLLMAPLHVLDYVVAHELAHLKIKNHSPRFWAKVKSIFPETAACRSWLRKNDRSLVF